MKPRWCISGNSIPKRLSMPTTRRLPTILRFRYVDRCSRPTGNRGGSGVPDQKVPRDSGKHPGRLQVQPTGHLSIPSIFGPGVHGGRNVRQVQWSVPADPYRPRSLFLSQQGDGWQISVVMGLPVEVPAVARNNPCDSAGDRLLYDRSPAGQGPDGKFPAGTVVTVLKEAGSYMLVESKDGIVAYVASGSVKPADIP